jgi:ADP-ribose pyrophosphatase
MIQKWKFINRKLLLDHPRMRIIEDDVELPNGQRVSYIRHAPDNQYSVAVIAVNKKDEILLQKEYSYPPNEVMYQLPGGHANNNEDILNAANRELSEESGYAASDCKIIGSFYTDNRRSDRKQYVVVCKNLKKHKLKHDDEEFIENYWMSYDAVKKLIANGEITNVNLLAAMQLFDLFK